MTEWKLSSVDFVNFPFFWDVSIRNSLRSNNFVREPHRYLDLNRRQFSFRHPHSIRENIFLSSGIFLVRLTYPFLSRTSKYFVLEVYISGMGVRVEWFVSIITSSKYNGEKKGEWTRRFVPPNERRKLEREICSARWICHLFISRRCYAVYDLRRQAPATTTTRIPDATPALPAPSGVVASARLWKSSEQQVERLYMILSFRPSAGSWLGVLAYRRPCNHASQCGFIGAASCSSVTADLCGPGS